MAVVPIKSNSIIALDASPIVAQAAGEGGPGDTKCNDGVIPTTANTPGASIGSVFQLVRVPSNCKVKKVWIESGAQAAGTMNVGLYYATDGSNPNGVPTAASGIANAVVGSAPGNQVNTSFFTAAYALTAASQPTDITNGPGGINTADKRQLPLWKAAGLNSDPGGYFDICGTLAAAITTGGGLIGLTVVYTD